MKYVLATLASIVMLTFTACGDKAEDTAVVEDTTAVDTTSDSGDAGDAGEEEGSDTGSGEDTGSEVEDTAVTNDLDGGS